MKVAVGVEVMTKAFVMLLLFIFRYKDCTSYNNKITGKARPHLCYITKKPTTKGVSSDCGFNNIINLKLIN